jgi:sterol desaturase/sphingolipid hydroxylase (fatty acid hydroxylase superfamily)
MGDVAAAIVRQFLLFAAVLTPLELVWPAHRDQGMWRRGLVVDLVYVALNPFLIGAAASVVLGALAAALDAVMPAGVRAALSSQPWAVQLGEIVLLSEIAAYWVHRWSHASPLLWRFHGVHHSAEKLDWIASHRQHPLEATWMLAVANLPALALGFSLEPIVGFVLAQKLYTAFLHANVGWGYGRVGRWLASPRFHHWHHDGAPGSRPKNFAALFPFLDRLWGTFDVPAGLPEKYGDVTPAS